MGQLGDPALVMTSALHRGQGPCSRGRCWGTEHPNSSPAGWTCSSSTTGSAPPATSFVPSPDPLNTLPAERKQGLEPSGPTQHLLVPQPGTPHCSEQQDLGWEPTKELMWGDRDIGSGSPLFVPLPEGKLKSACAHN